MTEHAPRRIVQGRAAPEMVLCRQCVQYVSAGAPLCPHCGRDPRKIGETYRQGAYEAIEAVNKIEALLARRMTNQKR
jgi:hypothetical protein